MIDRAPKPIRCYDDLFTLLKLTNATTLSAYPREREFPDLIFGQTCLFVTADIFGANVHGLRKATHETVRNSVLLQIALASLWIPGDNSKTSWKSPLMQLAFEASPSFE